MSTLSAQITDLSLFKEVIGSLDGISDKITIHICPKMMVLSLGYGETGITVLGQLHADLFDTYDVTAAEVSDSTWSFSMAYFGFKTIFHPFIHECSSFKIMVHDSVDEVSFNLSFTAGSDGQHVSKYSVVQKMPPLNSLQCLNLLTSNTRVLHDISFPTEFLNKFKHLHSLPMNMKGTRNLMDVTVGETTIALFKWIGDSPRIFGERFISNIPKEIALTIQHSMLCNEFAKKAIKKADTMALWVAEEEISLVMKFDSCVLIHFHSPCN